MSKRNKFIILLCINILIVLLVKYIESYFNIELPERKSNYENRYIELFFFAAFLAPLLEEFSYRYPLVKGKYVYISLIFGSLFSILQNSYRIEIMIVVIFLNIIAFILYFFFNKKQLPPFLLGMYIISFGISHIPNYELTDLIILPWYSLILLFNSQFLLGVFLTYIRLNYQFRYTLLYHSLYNFIIFLFFLLSIYIK